MTLDAAERERFRLDGFLAIEGFADETTCDGLRQRMTELLAAFQLEGVTTVFGSDDQSHARDDWFLESGDKIRFFFEPGAFGADGRLGQAPDPSINKVGHALHDLDPVFASFSRSPPLKAVAESIGMSQPLLLQSMYIFKQPRIGGEVTCHQDSTFLHTEPLSCVGLWLALEDADEANGCLWAERGGHLRPLRERFVRRGQETSMELFDPTPLPVEGLTPLPAAKGTLILLHGQLPHRSGPNLTDRSRHAYTLHLIDGACRYSPDNWLCRGPDMPLRGF